MLRADAQFCLLGVFLSAPSAGKSVVVAGFFFSVVAVLKLRHGFFCTIQCKAFDF